MCVGIYVVITIEAMTQPQLVAPQHAIKCGLNESTVVAKPKIKKQKWIILQKRNCEYSKLR